MPKYLNAPNKPAMLFSTNRQTAHWIIPPFYKDPMSRLLTAPVFSQGIPSYSKLEASNRVAVSLLNF